MHVHELNPWRTLIVMSVFVIVIIIGFITIPKPLLTYMLDMKQSISELNDKDALFTPQQLEDVISGKLKNVVLFDIRDNFVFGQGHIPGAENISANNLTLEESIDRLDELKKQNYTVVLYGEDQLQANGPWMLFRQVGFDNVKILQGGYHYYLEHKENLAGDAENTYQKEIPRYDYAEMTTPKDGSAINSNINKKPITIQRRQKSSVAAGGC